MTHKGWPSLLTALVAASAVFGLANGLPVITRRCRASLPGGGILSWVC